MSDIDTPKVLAWADKIADRTADELGRRSWWMSLGIFRAFVRGGASVGASTALEDIVKRLDPSVARRLIDDITRSK